MTNEEFKAVQEICKDAESCSRLSRWEEEFISNIRDKLSVHKSSLNLSDKQWSVIRRIEEKLYA